MLPYSLRGLFGFPSYFLVKPSYTGRVCPVKHSSREEAQWQSEQWRDDFEGVLGAVYAGKGIPTCSCGCPSPTLLFSLIFRRGFTSLSTDFF